MRDQGANVLVTIQAGVTLGFAPFVCFYIVTIMFDCTAFSPHGSWIDFQVISTPALAATPSRSS